jgi:ferredoxin
MSDVDQKKRIKRNIIKINEVLCTGCGKCVISCSEGALTIVDGKAKVINEAFCDGLAACIGECPEGALSIEEREAPEFNEEAVEKHLEKNNKSKEPIQDNAYSHQCSCPSSKTIIYDNEWTDTTASGEIPSALRQWPTKLTLVNPVAPYFNSEELIIVSDCSPVAYGDFHRKILRGKPIVTICPMLGVGEVELNKLEQILEKNPIKSLLLVLMEVPCCQQLRIFLEPILNNINRSIAVREIIISRDGQIIKNELS